MGKKHSKKRQRRQQEYESSKKVKLVLSESPWWSNDAADADVWKFVRFGCNKTIWKLLGSSLHLLFSMLNTWETNTTQPHSSPFYAILWWTDLHLSDEHDRRLRNAALKPTSSLDNASAQQISNEIWKEQVYAKAERLQYSFVKQYIRTQIWDQPAGLDDALWKNYNEWKALVRAECEGTRLNALYNHLWPIFVGACSMTDAELEQKLQAISSKRDLSMFSCL